MRKTKLLSVTAVLTALYFVLSVLLKIPVVGHITLDLGYIALSVASVCLGAVPAMAVGGLGALLESAMMSMRGVSPGWILMNVIAGFLCGLVLHRTVEESRTRFTVSAALVIPLSLLLGVVVKTLVDCALYEYSIAAKIPSSTAAWITDSLVMFAGLPVSLAVKKHLR